MGSYDFTEQMTPILLIPFFWSSFVFLWLTINLCNLRHRCVVYTFGCILFDITSVQYAERMQTNKNIQREDYAKLKRHRPQRIQANSDQFAYMPFIYSLNNLISGPKLFNGRWAIKKRLLQKCAWLLFCRIMVLRWQQNVI